MGNVTARDASSLLDYGSDYELKNSAQRTRPRSGVPQRLPQTSIDGNDSTVTISQSGSTFWGTRLQQNRGDSRVGKRQGGNGGINISQFPGLFNNITKE